MIAKKHITDNLISGSGRSLFSIFLSDKEYCFIKLLATDIEHKDYLEYFTLRSKNEEKRCVLINDQITKEKYFPGCLKSFVKFIKDIL